MWNETKQYAPKKPKTTKVTLENEYGTYSVEVNQTELALNDLVRDVIKPVILSAGYSPTFLGDHLVTDD